MKIIQLNSYCNIGSTGKIVSAISNYLDNKSVENYILYDYGFGTNKNHIRIVNKFYNKIQAFKSKLLGNYGFNSVLKTKKIIDTINAINPDIIHLHNIHAHFCNIEILFNYFKTCKVPIIWTFHDCFPYTAYCSHYSRIECSKWHSKCYKCPQFKKFSFIYDKSTVLFNIKRKLFNGAKFSIVAPSFWLANEIKKSFLSFKNIKVIHNGIDINKFKYKKNNIRIKYNIDVTKKIILLVTGKAINKGLEYVNAIYDFIKLIDFNKFHLMLVGNFQYSEIFNNKHITIINYIEDQNELINIYSCADVYINPTFEEIFGLVNIESLACSVPVVTFNSGGSPECIDKKTGIVVKTGDIASMYKAVFDICFNNVIDKSYCRKRAEKFSDENMSKNYYNLYQKVLLD